MNPFFTQLGPDQNTNLHQQRPYFLLPLKVGAKLRMGASLRDLASGTTAATKGLATAQAKAVKRIQNYTALKPVSDIYIMSHGWHRNFYSAVSAYDRFSSRLNVLLCRGRLPLPQPEEKYNPLLITLHWSSEIGQDGWIDLSGRRHKEDFLSNTAGYWVDSHPIYLDTFEDIFELFSALCAPDTEALDPKLLATSQRLHGDLQSLPMKGCLQNLDSASRVSLAWKCYHEAIPTGVHVPQQTQPEDFASYPLRAEVVLKFLIAAGGLVWLVPKVLASLSFLPHAFLEFLRKPDGLLITLLVLVLAPFASWAVLTLSCSLSRRNREAGRRYGLSWGSLLPWFVFQVFCIAPLLLTIFLYYLLPAAVTTAIGLFSERESSNAKGSTALLQTLSVLAQWPGRIMNGALGSDSILKTVSDPVESQVAFYQMQTRGVDAGVEAAGVLDTLLKEPQFANTRVHLFGHSFGGLVMTNLAREFGKLKSRKIHSLTFLEGAFGCAWFKNEEATVSNVSRTLASYYSGYDSATGFYYPLANAGRLAAGSVGFTEVPDPATGIPLKKLRP